MNRPLKVALFGTGFLAATRARCWRRVYGHEVDLVVAARDPAKAVAFAGAHGLAVRGIGLEAALADRSVQLVDLCVPNRVHRELAERAAAAGKHVLCTKPLAAFCGQGMPADAPAAAVAATPRPVMLQHAVADAEAMVAAAARAGVRLFYGENWLYAPAVRRAAALSAGAGGVILEMRGGESHSGSHSPYARDWRHTGGGALLRLGAHAIGAMVWLKRQEGQRRRGRPTVVTAVTAEVADVTAAVRAAGAACEVATGWEGVENWGSCVLHFDDGSRGIAWGADTLLGGMQSRLSILASDHRLECSLSPTDTLRAYAVRDGAFGSEYVMEKVHGQAGWSTPIPDEDEASGHQGLVQGVADELAGGPCSGADGALGVEVVRVVYSAYVSAAEGRRVAVRAGGGAST
jgi:predicted dehydrogenase